MVRERLITRPRGVEASAAPRPVSRPLSERRGPRQGRRVLAVPKSPEGERIPVLAHAVTPRTGRSLTTRRRGVILAPRASRIRAPGSAIPFSGVGAREPAARCRAPVTRALPVGRPLRGAPARLAFGASLLAQQLIRRRSSLISRPLVAPLPMSTAAVAVGLRVRAIT